MSGKKHKFNGSRQHINAILHMVGESVDVLKHKPTIRDIAAWMNVCKRTASKHIAAMVERGELIASKKPYKNTFRYEFYPTLPTEVLFVNNVYKVDYTNYANRVIGVRSDE